MPKLSLALFTRRTGGIDVAKYNLLRQTFRDFELLLVDELYEKRHTQVEKYFEGSGINLVHINASKEGHPVWKPWDFTVVRSQNMALTYATGELLVMNGDYWLMNPTALEAIWKAWEKWGRQGLTVLLSPHVRIFLDIKPSFRDYALKRKSGWKERGGSENLDAPPDTYISTYTQDFSTNPRIANPNVDERIPSARREFSYHDMRDPSPDDPPALKKHHAGSIGSFKYWIIGPGNAFSLIVPVEDAVKVNGWNHFFNGFWGKEEEINQRMNCAFKHRYLCTMAALAYNLPHNLWGADSPRHLGKGNRENMEKVWEKMRQGEYWADNPFNIAEERRKLRETGKTDISKY